MDFILTNNIVLPFKYSCWLTLSSMGFMIPSILAFQSQQYLSCIIYGLSCIGSTTYWIKPLYGPRRDIDVIISRIAYVYTMYRSVQLYNLYNPRWLIGISIPVLYTISWNLGEKTHYWIHVHFMFHMACIFGSTISVMGI